MQALILGLQLQRQIVRYSACKLWVWHCNRSAKLLDILHVSFEFGTAIAAPNCYKFCIQALSLAQQSQRQLVRYSSCRFWVWHCNRSAKLLDILHVSFEFGTAIAAPNCYKFCIQALSFALQSQRQLVKYSSCRLWVTLQLQRQLVRNVAS
jgi:hypothetical protein